MKIIEKISENVFLGQKETGVWEGTRYVIWTNAKLSVGESISKEEKINGTFKTLCEVCADVYDGGEDYSEQMKQQAIDFVGGYITKDELEII